MEVRPCLCLRDEDPLCLASAMSKIWHKNQDPEIALTEARKEMEKDKQLSLNIFNERK